MSSSPDATPEATSPADISGDATLPDLNVLSVGASSSDQNAIVLKWMRGRGMHDAAKRLEEEIRAGRAEAEPTVLVNDAGSASDGESGGRDGKDDSSKPLAKRRASARLAKQQKETISVQVLASRAAPKASGSTDTISSPVVGVGTSKKAGRGKSPVGRSPVTTSHPVAKSTQPKSTPPIPPQRDGSPSPVASPSTMSVMTPDFSQLFPVLAALPNLTSPQSAEDGQKLAANLLATLTGAGMTIEEAMARGAHDKRRGYRDLEDWVDGALDMYRPEFRPLLFPVFVHFYLELVLEGFRDAAQDFFTTHAPALLPKHTEVLDRLSAVTLPHLVAENELAQRFRSEKYVVRMSRSGFGLLLGWLMEGSGGEAMGRDEGFGGEASKKGRATVRRILNDRIDIEVTTSSSTDVSGSSWEDNTGLISSLIPTVATSDPTGPSVPSVISPMAFNQAKGTLKLGSAPVLDSLVEETKRVLKEEVDADTAMADGGETGMSAKARRLAAAKQDLNLIKPDASDLLPRPLLFRSMDVRREVEKVRDARKRIRLEPSVVTASDAELSLDRAAMFAKSGALPSICAYTFHDAQDSVCISKFSPDCSLMAAGFGESYIRLWSLKGEKLRGMRSDFTPSSIKDGPSLKKTREKHGSATRKLIGHSSAVYGLSFDPTSGSAAPPRHLLSCSSDATTRLWSLETMSNVVVYRGHQNPVWDVEWSPLGIYFATASRDRTARLWSTDRIAPLRMFAGHMSDVDCIRFHPNSLYLATGSSDQTCRLWDVQRGSCVRVFLDQKGAITSMAMSPDGRYLASAATDMSIVLWDLGSGRRIKTMTGHTALINSLSFSAESSMLVSGSCDWTVRCWDVKGSGGPRHGSGGTDEVQVDGFGLASRGSINGFGSSAPKVEGKLPESLEESDKPPCNETVDLIATYATKRTPVLDVHFTPRNLCLVSGTFISLPEQPSSMTS